MNPRSLFAALLVALLAGCSCAAVKDQVAASTSANETYTALVSATLDGSIAPVDGVPVSAADWSSTPPAVQALTLNLTRALWANSYGWHAASFALGQGSDPDATPDAWDPPAFPTPAPAPETFPEERD